MLIAEISNQHEGSMPKAKALIRMAYNCGADLVKSQAFKAEDFKTGSMTHSFYKHCEFSFDQYKELVDFARSLGIDMFYSILSDSLLGLNEYCNFKKITAFQTENYSLDQLRVIDNERLIISFRNQHFKMGVLKNSKCLLAIDYLENWSPAFIDSALSYNKNIGISDHSYGIDQIINMLRRFSFPIIEKHFYLGDQIIKDFTLYRDCIHAANPTEFSRLAKIFK